MNSRRRYKISHGFVTDIGRRSTNEDRVVVDSVPYVTGMYMFAVYDGHGGDAVSRYCAKHHKSILGESMRDYKRSTVVDCIGRSFELTEDAIEKDLGESANEAGSTAATVLFFRDKMYVAHCGDSRVVVERRKVAVDVSLAPDDRVSAQLRVEPPFVTKDHKPSDHGERGRIESCGAHVYFLEGACRVDGILATSRSFGDLSLKASGVTETPDIIAFDVSDDIGVVIIATDGLWDVMSSEEAIAIAYGSKRTLSSNTHCYASARRLADVAHRRGSSDNVSVVVIALTRF